MWFLIYTDIRWATVLITYGGQKFLKHTVGKCFNYIRWAELLSIDGTLSIMMDSGVLGEEFD